MESICAYLRTIQPTDATGFWTMVQAIAVTVTLVLILRQMMAQVGQLKIQADQLKIQADQLKIQADQLKLQTEDLQNQTQQVAAQRLTNMLASITTFNESWDSVPMMRARRNVCQEYLDGRRDIESVSSRILLHHFEELGTFDQHGLFETDVLWSIFSETICWYWLVCEAKIADHRVAKGDDTFYECFGNLKEKMYEHSRSRGLVVPVRTESEIRAFVESQIKSLDARLTP